MPRSPAAQFACGEVMEHLRKPVFVEELPELLPIVVVRKQVFDPGKARGGRGGESVQKTDFVEHHRQVRSEFRHVSPRPRIGVGETRASLQ